MLRNKEAASVLMRNGFFIFFIPRALTSVQTKSESHRAQVKFNFPEPHGCKTKEAVFVAEKFICSEQTGSVPHQHPNPERSESQRNICQQLSRSVLRWPVDESPSAAFDAVQNSTRVWRG